ncbi:MAG: aminotransferase class V-fold PLP-dependent enzyme [Bacteroidota bacterium]|jgi:selenocysteine lyase/cysteine desulfurase|nr:aminotransferase class V-fold PLP-dependent enzyme [Sphingobacteriales bacterium]
MVSKRRFLKTLALSAGMPLTGNGKEWLEWIASQPQNNDFWMQIRGDYELKPDYINLENGYYSMMARPVMEAYLNDIRTVNKEHSYYMRTVQFENKFKTRDRLADLLGCKKEELIITRNTTESLDTIISGIDWKAGDEAIAAWQDYGSMLDMFRQQERRYGMKLKMVSVPNHPQNDEEIVSLYEKAITTKTKLIMICHMINITGQILPVRKICDMAHAHGVEVMVDGAHAVAHMQFKIDELNCDYYGSSLHKWLGAPLGAGILYVKQEKIKKIWPLFGESGFTDDDIRKLNHTGTIPVATDIAINHAIDYHLKIGIERKEARLKFLKNYWTEKVIIKKNVVLNTPVAPERTGAIANVGVKNIPPSQLAKSLLNKYKIWTVAIDNEKAGVQGVRITPHLYTTTEELDKLVQALVELST